MGAVKQNYIAKFSETAVSTGHGDKSYDIVCLLFIVEVNWK